MTPGSSPSSSAATRSPSTSAAPPASPPPTNASPSAPCWSTCSFADCATPFAWTKIHHVNPFNADGGHGKTNIDELTPVCGPCHDLAHHPDWHFDKLPDGSTITRAPDGTQWRRWPDRQRPAQPPPAAATHPGTQNEPAATLFTDAA